jgi:hypothetical protein
MIFLTFNDNPSGIYTSQVIDVVKLLNQKEPTKLVAFVSWRVYLEAKKSIKKEYSNSRVYPIIFGLSRWQKCSIILNWFKRKSKEKKCIARGPLAASIAIDLGFDKVCYDGRAAVSSEIEEFNVVEDQELADSFKVAERKAVLESDFRIAVSQTLVDFWRDKFGYKENQHVIIPCTLANSFQDVDIQKVLDLRNNLKIGEKDIVFVFSGGNAGWNSLERTFSILKSSFVKNSNYKLILLTGEADSILSFQKEFPNQVFRFWLRHDEVKNYLALGDYGLLIREDKITNNVASPVKFAEYLALGLNILISDNIKDYAKFIENHSCGSVISSLNEFSVNPLNENQKKRNKELAKTYLYKNSSDIMNKYEFLVKKMSI